MTPLINKVAIYAGIERKPFWEIDDAMWDRVMAVKWPKGTSRTPQT